MMGGGNVWGQLSNVTFNRDFPKQFDEPQDVPFARLSANRQKETV